MATQYQEPDTSSEAGAVDDGSDGRLRSAMLKDGQPSFPRWIPLPGVVLALVWAAYQGVSAEDGASAQFVSTLLWPGIAILVLTTVTAYFGWRLDLD